MSSYIPYGQSGLFSELFNDADVRASQKPLIRMGDLIQWNVFHRDLSKAFPISDQGGRPRFDPLLMFKIIVLQKVQGLLDDETSFQIMDRRSFKIFLGMTDEDQIPDGQTIADFRNQLIKLNLFEKLFNQFLHHLESKHGFKFCKQGTIVDATFVEVPINRNTIKENEQIKAGNPPKSISSKPQKDKDAR
jgi:transposase